MKIPISEDCLRCKSKASLMILKVEDDMKYRLDSEPTK